jgi:hypothetical protein
MEPPEGTAPHLMRPGLLQATVQGSMQLMTQGGSGASKRAARGSGPNKRQKATDGSIGSITSPTLSSVSVMLSYARGVSEHRATVGTCLLR